MRSVPCAMVILAIREKGGRLASMILQRVLMKKLNWLPFDDKCLTIHKIMLTLMINNFSLVNKTNSN